MSWRYRRFTWKPQSSLTLRENANEYWLVDFAYSHSPYKHSWQWEDSREANRSTWASPNRLQISRIVSGWSRHFPGNVSWRESAGLPVSEPFYLLPGRYQGQLVHGGRHAPARGSTRRPRYWFSTGGSSSGGRRRAPTATSRRRPGPRGIGGYRGIPPWQDVLDRLCLLLYCREMLGTVLDSVAEQSSLGAWPTAL